MGCGESQMKEKLNSCEEEGLVSLNRHEKKHQKLKVHFQDHKSTENVIKSPDQVLTEEDFTLAEETFSQHYLFFKLKEAQRRELINSIEVYTAMKEDIIF